MILTDYDPARPVWARCFLCESWNLTGMVRVWKERISFSEHRTYCDSCKKKLESEESESQTQKQ